MRTSLIHEVTFSSVSSHCFSIRIVTWMYRNTRTTNVQGCVLSLIETTDCFNRIYFHFNQYLSLLYKAEKPSVCLHFWHADNSAVSARIETGLARNESCVFEDHKVYFYKPIVPTVH